MILPYDPSPGANEPIEKPVPGCHDANNQPIPCGTGGDEYTQYMSVSVNPGPAYTYRDFLPEEQGGLSKEEWAAVQAGKQKCVGSEEACADSERLWQAAKNEALGQLPHNYCKWYPSDPICVPAKTKSTGVKQ